jgi:hypothetical protein
MKVKRLAVYAFIASILPVVAQESKTVAPAEWRYVKEDDPLHSKTHDRFILDGTYLTPPRTSTKTPSLVVECSAGKVDQNYFNTGVVVVHREQNQHGPLLIERRIDGKKKDLLSTGLSTDGQSVFFTRIDLKDVLAAKQVIIGVYEYLGAQVVLQFDIPDPSPVMEKCGEDKILKRTDRINKKAKCVLSVSLRSIVAGPYFSGK